MIEKIKEKEAYNKGFIACYKEAKRLKDKGCCTCDFDKFEPEKSTGHNLECACHKIAISQATIKGE